jgi:hypothetical protein
MTQIELSRYEIRRLPIGNQHTEDMSIIEYRALKGYAYDKGVSDWISHIDTSCTYRENLGLLDRQATYNSDQTMRQLASRLR